jgi:hypothetical protein
MKYTDGHQPQTSNLDKTNPPREIICPKCGSKNLSLFTTQINGRALWECNEQGCACSWIVQQQEKIEQLKSALVEALTYFPDAVDRYEYAWTECVGNEQEMVKEERSKLEKLLEEI